MFPGGKPPGGGWALQGVKSSGDTIHIHSEIQYKSPGAVPYQRGKNAFMFLAMLLLICEVYTVVVWWCCTEVHAVRAPWQGITIVTSNGLVSEDLRIEDERIDELVKQTYSRYTKGLP
ncbi:hypothetical protein M405DRAFT_839157 [Rhizopogon salebrosus TDB-379]|nr:hypothetical protein M405DRAFT_839157 [Rhizopogon salebrosus TDB-379]